MLVVQPTKHYQPGMKVRVTGKWSGHELGDIYCPADLNERVFNIQCAVNQGTLEVVDEHFEVPVDEGKTVKRYLRHRGRGMYDVVEGVLINNELLSKQQAQQLVDEQ